MAGFSPLCDSAAGLLALFQEEQRGGFQFDANRLEEAGIPIRGVSQRISQLLEGLM